MPNFDSTQSRVKLLVYLLDGTPLTRYSFAAEDRKGVQYSVAGMVRRLLLGRYRGRYNTAVFYDNDTGQELQKWVRGVREV